ncbi:uncharacterized protein TM35_000034870 [Trypanosoma theileri]|uniref:Uncharacterized protein n=1 Tax=Trypanosoma theileri TaxID=67003 RepID=A0A1X0P727_9TRYP|nr:uncharacterized protein TM35_000034870 [Trypanosoma theileri]ORC92734.1 hypothetical protein TM35_000034870 [Trypanosoma theileri]
MIQLRQRQTMHLREQKQQQQQERQQGKESCEASLSTGRVGDAFSDEVEEERERSIQRLPASIQAMLLRSNRTLSISELNIMANATSDNRCEALRMIFEGKSADEAISFLLNVSDGTKNARTTSGTVATVVDPPTRAATMHTAVGDVNRSCSRVNDVLLSSTSRIYPTQRKSIERTSHSIWSESENPPSPLHVAPIPSVRELRYNDHSQRPISPISTVMSHCHNAPDSGDESEIRINSPSIQVPSLHTRKSPTPVQPLSDVRINTVMYPKPVFAHKEMCNNAPVLAKRVKNNDNRTVDRSRKEMDSRAAPGDIYAPQVSCSAWDEHYKTFIVHPNQLRRLEEERKLREPPAAVRPGTNSALRRLPSEERRRFSRQNTPSIRLRPPPPAPLINSSTPLSSAADTSDRHISSSHTGKKVSSKSIKSQKQEQFTKDDKQELSIPVVPPLKGIKKCTRRKEDVFTRLYSSNNTCLTPRTVMTRETFSARSVRSGITTPRRGFSHRSSPSTRNRTPRRRVELTNDYMFGVSTQPLMSSRRHTVSTGLTNTLAHGKGVPLTGAHRFVRSNTSSGKPLTRSFSAQKLRRTSTVANYTCRSYNNDNNKSSFDYHYNQYARTPTWSARYSEFVVQREQRNGFSGTVTSSHNMMLKRSATLTALR